MSQQYFDTFINKIGELANNLAKVVDQNKILNEEINTWVED